MNPQSVGPPTMMCEIQKRHAYSRGGRCCRPASGSKGHPCCRRSQNEELAGAQLCHQGRSTRDRKQVKTVNGLGFLQKARERSFLFKGGLRCGNS